MDLFAISLAIVSGICLATGIVYLFMGLRWRGTDMVHLAFGLFALVYSGAVLTALLMYRSDSLAQYLAVDLWSGVFAVLAQILWRVIAHWRANRYVLLSSAQTRAELAAILARPRINLLATASLDDLVRGIERYTWHVPGALDLSGACRDPKDDKFLACALEGQAHYLVSSDKDLLHMRLFRKVVIHNAGQFLLVLELSLLDAKAMAQRFDRGTLVDIQENLLLEPRTASRLATAVGLAVGDRRPT